MYDSATSRWDWRLKAIEKTAFDFTPSNRALLAAATNTVIFSSFAVTGAAGDTMVTVKLKTKPAWLKDRGYPGFGITFNTTNGWSTNQLVVGIYEVFFGNLGPYTITVGNDGATNYFTDLVKPSGAGIVYAYEAGIR